MFTLCFSSHRVTVLLCGQIDLLQTFDSRSVNNYVAGHISIIGPAVKIWNSGCSVFAILIQSLYSISIFFYGHYFSRLVVESKQERTSCNNLLCQILS